MARIIVTTDDGQVMENWQDNRDEIGDVSKSMAARSLMEDIAREVARARRIEQRKEDGSK